MVTANEKKATIETTPAKAERPFMRKRKNDAGLKTETKVEKKCLGTYEITCITRFFFVEPR